jgi:hypothetical protein
MTIVVILLSEDEAQKIILLFCGKTNGLPEAHLAVVDSDRKAATGVSADPGFIHNTCPISAIIGKGQQNPGITLLTLRKPFLHTLPPPFQGKPFKVNFSKKLSLLQDKLRSAPFF